MKTTNETALPSFCAEPPQLNAGFPVLKTNYFDAVARASRALHRPNSAGKLNILDDFRIPKTLPWEKVFAIYDPGYFSYNEILEHAMIFRNVVSEVHVDLEEYISFRKPGRPRLVLIEDSMRPTEDTIGFTAAEMLRYRHGYEFLGLRDYIIAWCQCAKIHTAGFDRETRTLFPTIRSHNDGTKVARGGKIGFRRIRVDAVSEDEKHADTGARVIFECEPLV